jgi:hypothetical protein
MPPSLFYCLTVLGALYTIKLQPPTARRAPTTAPTGSTTLTLAAATANGDGTRERRVEATLSMPLDRTAQVITASAAPAQAGAKPNALGTDKQALRLVQAALVHAGLDGGAHRIDAVASRARAAALLPELHLRVLSTDSDIATTTVDDATAQTQTAARQNRRIWLEGKAVFHLDRVLYSNDEPALLRLRADALEAQTRMTTHVLGLYFHWRRANRDAQSAPPGSLEAEEAELRGAEAAAALDVATGGFFSRSIGAEGE